MKIVPFPKPGDAPDDAALATQIEAALHDRSGGEAAEYWRELRADVRSLAPPISPQFERELRERLAQRAASANATRERRPGWASLANLRALLGSGMRVRVFALGGACAMAAVLVLAIAAPWRASESGSASSASKSGRVEDFVQTLEPSHASGASAAAAKSETAKVEPTKVSTPASGGGEAPATTARVQQRAASITLAPKPQAVQTVADQVAQLAARDGGFVQSSQVHEQRGQGGEADIDLSLPSARLSAALAELARLAPTRAQSQSLQDITDEYAGTRTKLADAVAERQALLRALAKAGTQGQIESLRARISLVGGNIVKDRAALAAVSQRGSNSAVEVTVLGDAHAGSAGSTLQKGLHDAGDVLKVALAVLIVALAVLVPLALLAALVALTWRLSRRRLRERALS
jgi:hypothetical protein